MASKTHVVLPGSKRGKDPTATRVGEVDPKEKIVVTIGPSGPKLPSADEYVGKNLDAAELAEKFGAKQGGRRQGGEIAQEVWPQGGQKFRWKRAACA